MQRYFAILKDNEIILSENDAHHVLHVMRMKKGDEIEAVCNNKLYSAIIKETSPLKIVIDYEIPSESELPVPVTLFFALAKGDKIDFVVQKATELGASKIVLINTERSIVKFEGNKVENKLERFRKIAKEASEQSHRLRIPEIVGVIDIKRIPDELLADINLLAYEKEAGSTSSLDEAIDHKSVSIMIGPEGGFSEKEVELLVSKGFKLVSLGKRILRTETAAIYALSVIGFKMEK